MMLRCDKTIGLLLPYAFRIRYKEILHKAHTIAFAAASKFLTLLTREDTSWIREITLVDAWDVLGQWRVWYCGSLKKPDFLMEKGPNNEVFDPKRKLAVTKTLKVKVYLGDGWRLDFSHTHFDSYSPPDFYTKVYIVGVPADAAKKKTKIIEDNWSPAWNQEFTFPLTVPELALLRIEGREYDMSEKDDFGGQACLPVSDLRPGIRSVPLHDKKGEKLKNVRLMMGFQFV